MRSSLGVILWALLLAELVHGGHPRNNHAKENHLVESDGESDELDDLLEEDLGDEYEDEEVDDVSDDDEYDDTEEESSLKHRPGKNSIVVDVAGADLGVPQVLNSRQATQILAKLQEARNYFSDFVSLDTTYGPVQKLCKNKHEQCGAWAVLGECENNPLFMRPNCAPLCQSCKDLHVDTRCPLRSDAPVAWQPGDMHRMFERILSEDEFQQYEPKVLSRPSFADGDTEDTANYQIGPWVAVLDNFLTDGECERLIELGAIEGYNRSSDVGEKQADGTFALDFNRARTSENAWCKDTCYNDKVTKQVLEKMTNVTKIHDTHAEYLQLLKYEEGQFYKTHHDYIPMQKMRVQGSRILTVFLYLNDVEEGGGTNFPELDLTVMPKKGRALLWPSVRNESPNSMDTRTEHQALPVTKGVKYGANAWYHQRDFKTPHRNGCS